MMAQSDSGAVADLGTFIPKLHWDAAVYYWSSSLDYTGWDWSLRDVAIKTQVKYHFMEGQWEPYVGGGFGMHFFSWDYDYPSGYHGITFDDSSTEFGFQFIGGIQYKINQQWKASGELELDWADLDQTHLQFGFIYNLTK